MAYGEKVSFWPLLTKGKLKAFFICHLRVISQLSHPDLQGMHRQKV